MLNTFFIFCNNLKTVLINSVPFFLNIVSFTILGIIIILWILYTNKTTKKLFYDFKSHFDQLTLQVMFININILIFILFILYKYFFTTNNNYIFLIITGISFLLFTFILDKFQFSSSIIIKKLQQILFSIIILILMGYVYYYVQTPIYCSTEDGEDLSKSRFESTNSQIKNSEEVGVNSNNEDSSLVKDRDGDGKESISITKDSKYYNLKIDKDIADKGFKTIGTAITKGLESWAPHAGAGTAAGAIGTGVFKATASLPPLQRLGTIGAATLVGGAAAKVGIDLGTTITKHSESAIKNSPHADTNIDRIPSPDNDFNINSMLEYGETGDFSPLFILIRSELFIDILILILIISFLVLIFNKYILTYNLEWISNLISKKSKRLHDWLISTNIKNKSNFYNNKLFFILFIINSLLLIYMLFLKIYITSVLFVNLDEYAIEHINITKSSLLLLSLKYKLKKLNTSHWSSHVASGSAAGVLGAAAIKSTAGMTLGARVLTVGATTGVGALAAKLGVDAASVVSSHASSSIKNSPHADTNIDRVPSPDQNFDISSMLESSEVTSPLFILIRIEFLLNLLSLILIISFLILIFNKYFLSYNLELITKLLNKFSFLNRLNAWFRARNLKNASSTYNNRMFFYLFIINTIILLYMLLLKLTISAILLNNLDDYIQGHIDITKSSLLLLSLKCKLKKLNTSHWSLTSRSTPTLKK
jgi:hypothetical protein